MLKVKKRLKSRQLIICLCHPSLLLEIFNKKTALCRLEFENFGLTVFFRVIRNTGLFFLGPIFIYIYRLEILIKQSTFKQLFLSLLFIFGVCYKKKRPPLKYISIQGRLKRFFGHMQNIQNRCCWPKVKCPIA